MTASQVCPNAFCGPDLYEDELWIPVTTYNTSDCSKSPVLESWIRNDSCVQGGYTSNAYYNYIANTDGATVERLNCGFDVDREERGFLAGCFGCVSSVPPVVYSYGMCVDGVVVGAPSRPPVQSEWTTSRSRLGNRVDMGTGCLIANPGNTPVGRPTRKYTCTNGTLHYSTCSDVLCSTCGVFPVKSTCCTFDGPGENRWQASCQEFERRSYPRPRPPSPPPLPDEESNGARVVPSLAFTVFIAVLVWLGSYEWRENN